LRKKRIYNNLCKSTIKLFSWKI